MGIPTKVTAHSGDRDRLETRGGAGMELLQAGVEPAVIALWLGHESIKTTQMYLDAHLALKEAALAKVEPHSGQSVRFHADDRLLQFLNNL